MSDFTVDEKGCDTLMQNLENNIRQIALIDNDLADSLPTLRRALGDDYEGLKNSIKIITDQLGEAIQQLSIVRSCTSEYMARVKQIRVTLN